MCYRWKRGGKEASVRETSRFFLQRVSPPVLSDLLSVFCFTVCSLFARSIVRLFIVQIDSLVIRRLRIFVEICEAI